MNPTTYAELADLANDIVVVDTIDYPKNTNIYINRPHKVIILSQFGDFLVYDNLQNTDKQFVFITTHTVSSTAIERLKDTITFIVFPNGYSEYTKFIPNPSIDYQKIKNSIKTKHFLSLNNRVTWYRQGLFYFFKSFDLLEKSYFSYLGDLHRSSFNQLSDADYIFKLNENDNAWYVGDINFTEIKKEIPYTTGVEIPKNIDWGIGDQIYYEDCFCSIVTETYAAEEVPFFTEKTFKPILFFQPFLIHGNVGCLKELKSIGFKTFDQWWDESYDELFAHQRFEAMLKVILEISEWSIEKINKTYQEMLPILEHNHHHFTTTLPQLYNVEIQEVKKKITDIIESVK
jgi:hypothetical protein